MFLPVALAHLSSPSTAAGEELQQHSPVTSGWTASGSQATGQSGTEVRTSAAGYGGSSSLPPPGRDAQPRPRGLGGGRAGGSQGRRNGQESALGQPLLTAWPLGHLGRTGCCLPKVWGLVTCSPTGTVAHQQGQPQHKHWPFLTPTTIRPWKERSFSRGGGEPLVLASAQLHLSHNSTTPPLHAWPLRGMSFTGLRGPGTWRTARDRLTPQASATYKHSPRTIFNVGA